MWMVSRTREEQLWKISNKHPLANWHLDILIWWKYKKVIVAINSGKNESRVWWIMKYISIISFRDSSPPVFFSLFYISSFHIPEVTSSLTKLWIFNQLNSKCKKGHNESNHIIIQKLSTYSNIRYQLNIFSL